MKFYIAEKGLRLGWLMVNEYDAASLRETVAERPFSLPPEGDDLLADGIVERTGDLCNMTHLGKALYNTLTMAGSEETEISPPATSPGTAITLTELRSQLWFSIGESAMKVTQEDITKLKELGYLG